MANCVRNIRTKNYQSPGPNLAGGKPGASWWEASAQLLHN